MAKKYDRMTAAALAVALKRHRSTVYRWASAGMPKNADGTFTLADVVTWLIDRATTDAESMTPAAAGDSPALEEWRKERVKMAKIERKKLEGSVIEIDDVHRSWGLRVAEVSAGLETLADRLPPLLLEKDRAEMRTILSDAVWHLRDNYSRGGSHCPPEVSAAVLAFLADKNLIAAAEVDNAESK